MKRNFSPLFAATLFFAAFAVNAAPVNINTADVKTLDNSLVGVGPKAAKAIVDYRNRNGAFRSIDDLAKVKGIGPKLVEKNKDNILLK